MGKVFLGLLIIGLIIEMVKWIIRLITDMLYFSRGLVGGLQKYLCFCYLIQVRRLFLGILIFSIIYYQHRNKAALQGKIEAEYYNARAEAARLAADEGARLAAWKKPHAEQGKSRTPGREEAAPGPKKRTQD